MQSTQTSLDSWFCNVKECGTRKISKFIESKLPRPCGFSLMLQHGSSLSEMDMNDGVVP